MLILDFSQLQKVEEGVYIKRSKFWGTRCVYPYKNDDGTWNKFNLLTGGSWGNLVFVTIVCLLLIGSVLAYKHDIKSCADALNYAVKNPCEWCEIVTQNRISNLGFADSFKNLTINFSDMG